MTKMLIVTPMIYELLKDYEEQNAVNQWIHRNTIDTIAKQYSYLEKENQQAQKEYKEMRGIVDLGCVNITKDGVAHMSKETLEKKEQKLDLYKSVLNEVREVLNYCIKHYGVHNMTTKDFDALLEILDKVGGSNE